MQLFPRLFAPSAATGVALRRHLNNELAGSFEHIFEASANNLAIPGKALDAFLARLRSGTFERPAIYSLHFHLIGAIERDDLAWTQALVDRIASVPPANPAIAISWTNGGPLCWRRRMAVAVLRR